jgi:hypothetical protein
LAAFAWTLYVGLLIFGIRRKKLAGAFFLRGIAIFFAAMMISPIVIALISLLIDGLYHDYKAFPQGDTYNIGYYLIGYSFMALAIVTTLYGYWQKQGNLIRSCHGGNVLVAGSLNCHMHFYTWGKLFIRLAVTM